MGVPIFKGKPKALYFQPIADKIKSKLSAWKASLLSMAGRLQLTKSMVHGMIIRSISVHSWPRTLLKDIERWIRNFLWSDDISQRKLVAVAWHKVCLPFSEGGLRIRSLTSINEAENHKLCWELFNSTEAWAILLKNRVLRITLQFPIISSLPCGVRSIKSEFQVLYSNVSWLVGDGENINFWKDPWCGTPLFISLNLPQNTLHSLCTKVSDFISNFWRNVPFSVQAAFPNINQMVNQVTLPSPHRRQAGLESV